MTAAGFKKPNARPNAFFRKADMSGGFAGCWPWRGTLTEGYGHIGRNPVSSAHRYAYELFVGPIPDGFSIDHLCHGWDRDCPGGVTCPHRSCVNPAHLEAVTQGENVLRSALTMPYVNATKTHCPRGHAYTPENTRIKRTATGTGRECKRCKNDARIERRLAAVAT